MCFFAKTEEALHVSLKVLESPETYPGLPSRPDAKVLLRIWRYAAHLQSCYIVSECPDGLFLRRLTRTNLTNDFYGSETPLEQGGFARLSAELDKIHIPPFLISESFGLDGTTCGIEKERFAGKARLERWDAPKAWGDLQKWHARTLEVFESALPGNTAAEQTRDAR